MIIENQLDVVTAVGAALIHDGGLAQVALGQKRRPLDGYGVSLARDKDGAGPGHIVAIALQIKPDGGLFPFGVLGLLAPTGATGGQKKGGQRQIDVELVQATLHISTANIASITAK